MNFVIHSFRGYFERVDSWGNPRWTTNKSRAFQGDFATVSAEAQAYGLKGIEIVEA